MYAGVMKVRRISVLNTLLKGMSLRVRSQAVATPATVERTVTKAPV